MTTDQPDPVANGLAGHLSTPDFQAGNKMDHTYGLNVGDRVTVAEGKSWNSHTLGKTGTILSISKRGRTVIKFDEVDATYTHEACDLIPVMASSAASSASSGRKSKYY